MLNFLYNTVLKTGLVALPLFLVGLFAWFLLLETLFFFFSEAKTPQLQRRFNAFFQKNAAHTGPSSKSVSSHYSLTAQTFIALTLSGYHQKLATVRLFASIALLLGLLGTVNGMIDTFQTISIYGNSNPILMAEGISKALLTTQAGLVIAAPLLLFLAFLKASLKRFKTRFLKHLTASPEAAKTIG